MKLIAPPASPELRGDLVNSFGNDKRRPVDSLCEEVAERAVETAGEENAVAILNHQCEGAVDRENSVEITSEQPLPGFRFVDRPEPL